MAALTLTDAETVFGTLGRAPFLIADNVHKGFKLTFKDREEMNDVLEHVESRKHDAQTLVQQHICQAFRRGFFTLEVGEEQVAVAIASTQDAPPPSIEHMRMQLMQGFQSLCNDEELTALTDTYVELVTKPDRDVLLDLKFCTLLRPVVRVIGMPERGTCARCGKAISHTKCCERCRAVGYCDRDCQKADWEQRHNNLCKAYATYTQFCKPLLDSITRKLSEDLYNSSVVVHRT